MTLYLYYSCYFVFFQSIQKVQKDYVSVLHSLDQTQCLTSPEITKIEQPTSGSAEERLEYALHRLWVERVHERAEIQHLTSFV